MKLVRRLLDARIQILGAVVAVASLAFTTRTARAEPGEPFYDFPPAPVAPGRTAEAKPRPGSSPSTSRPSEAAATRAREAVVPPVAGAVRLRFRTSKGKRTARIEIHRDDGSYALVCTSPCTAELPPRTELRITLDDEPEAPRTVVVPANAGSEVDLEVRPATKALVGSIVVMSAGAGCVLGGALLVWLGRIGASSNGVGRFYAPFEPIGYATIGIGAALVAGGFVWLTSRSHEPQVLASPSREPETYGRRDTLLGDAAPRNARDASSVTPPPFMPLQFAGAF